MKDVENSITQLLTEYELRYGVEVMYNKLLNNEIVLLEASIPNLYVNSKLDGRTKIKYFDKSNGLVKEEVLTEGHFEQLKYAIGPVE